MSNAVERPRFAVRVDNGRLVADGPYEQEQIDRLPKGRIFIEVDTEAAEDGMRNMYMAGIGKLFDNVDGAGPGGKWPTDIQLRREILRGIGFAEPIKRVDGIKMEARSMAKGRMTYDEYVKILELSRTYCFDRWGFDPWQDWQDEKDLEKQRR